MSVSLSSYLDLKKIQEVSILQPIVHRMIDFITEKQKMYIQDKSLGDAKLLFNCLWVCNSIISNNFYTFEKKLNQIVQNLFTIITLSKFREESIKDSSLIIELKRNAAKDLKKLI